MSRGISNAEIASVLNSVSEYLAMEDMPFKPQAYAKAASALEDMDKSVTEIYATEGIKGLKGIPGVGQSIAEHIEELIQTGKLEYYEKLKREAPVDLASLTAVEGLGPKSIKKLYSELGIRNLTSLEKAARAKKIRGLAGFGPKKEERILEGIAFLKKGAGRTNLGKAMPTALSLERKLREAKGVQRLTLAGSLRRRKETIGDIDILAVAKSPKKLMEFFVGMPSVGRILAQGRTKSSVNLSAGLQVDLRVIPKESYGAALNYFTGSKEHNVALRELAIRKGLKLNEYGLWKGKKRVAGDSEEGLYKALGLQYIPPEMRENTGEIQAAQKGKLPEVISQGDLKGDLQVQTDWTDGKASIEEMAKEAASRGLKYIAITDHTKRLSMAHGLDEKRLLSQMAVIDRAQKKLGSKIRILKGTECDILKDGSLDLPDRVLSKLDVVGVSLHSYFNLPRKEQTARALRAMRNPHADIFFHPTGRIIGRRKPCDLDMELIVATAKETGTILEINAYPDRLDLKDSHVRMAVEAGVKMSISSDAHAPSHFDLLPYGISQARRGWATAADIINTRSVSAMLKLLKK